MDCLFWESSRDPFYSVLNLNSYFIINVIDFLKNSYKKKLLPYTKNTIVLTGRGEGVAVFLCEVED